MTDEQISIELLKCSASSAYFIDTYCYVEDTQGLGNGTGTIRFKLWNFQVGLLWQLEQERLTIILKPRQLGISWLVCAWELWRATFSNTQLILLFSIGDKEAIELLRRVKMMYEKLPEWMKEYSPFAKKPNTEVVEFKNGSRILSLPSSEAKGSGYTASSVMLDEFAKNPVDDNLFAAIMPTVEAGTGQLIIVSTAFGIGNKFHKLWIKAARGESHFKPVFFPWWVRPGRDQAWYDERVAEETDPDRVKENYPANPTEAFRASGTSRFKQAWIESQSKNVRQPLAVVTHRELAKLESVQVYELPQSGHEYLIGADTAEGLEGGNYDSAVVVDRADWSEVACLHGQWEPDYFAKMMMVLSQSYQGAMIAVERNNHGHAVLATFKLLGFADLIMDADHHYGLKTNLKTKPECIDILAEALRDELIQVRTQATLDEMLNYRREPNGTTSAPSGYFDDHIMAWAMALAAMRRPEESFSIGSSVEIKIAPETARVPIDADHGWNRHAHEITRPPIKEKRSFYRR